MKNFYLLEETPLRSLDISNIINLSLNDIKEYFTTFSFAEKKTYMTILHKDFIKMYAILIKINDHGYKVGNETSNDLFNLSIDCPEQNYNNGNNGLRMHDIHECLNISSIKYDKNAFFKNTCSLIPDNTALSWIMFYKNGATVNPHTHEDNVTLAHFLLEDIVDGSFYIKVNEETKIISKKGDYFIFDGKETHSAYLEGKHAHFFVTTIDSSFIDNNC